MAKNKSLFTQYIYRTGKQISHVYSHKVTTYGRYQQVSKYPLIRVSFKPEKSDRKKYLSKSETDFSIFRTKQKIFQIAEANHMAHGKYQSIFATFTFKQQYKSRKITDVLFRNFIRRYTRHTKTNLRYLAIPELHISGAIHYHAIFFNFPYIPILKFKEIWKYGSVDLQLPRDIKNISRYLSKYITKDLLTTNHKKSQRRYLSSNNLILPIDDFTLSFNSDNLQLLESLRTPNKLIYKYASPHIHPSQQRHKLKKQ